MKTYKILKNFETLDNRKFAAGDSLSEAELNDEEMRSAVVMNLIIETEMAAQGGALK